MQNSTLFPLEEEPIEPATNRCKPVLWLKRLVILSALDSKNIIRDIEFRRGLNIIQTHQMETEGGPVAGHSVGKTLLMRLIRYTLGESHFGTEETEKEIATALETAHVVGHWSVDDTDWVVVRPMQDAPATDSFAARSDNWQQIVGSPQRDHSHREFVQAVNDAVLSELPTFKLPRGREAKWLDILAWLSRDYQSGYRKANDWRHEDANSGPSLDLKENRLIMQWVMGLMSQEEIELRLKRHKLRDELGNQKQSSEREQKTLDTLWPVLREKMELKEDVVIAGQQTTFDSIDPEEKIADTITSLEKLKQGQLSQSSVKDIKLEQDGIQDKINNAEANVISSRSLISYKVKEIKEYEDDPLKPYGLCKADPCWIKEKAKEVANDPAKDHNLVDLQGELNDLKQSLSDAKREKKTLQTTLNDTNKRLKKEQERLGLELSGIDERVGRWKSFEKEAELCSGIAASVSRSTKLQTKTDGDVKSSSKLLEDVRKKHGGKINRISDIYQQLLQQIFGQAAIGCVQLDGDGLRPVPDKKLAPAGAALSVMTTVLTFDIACVAASMDGTGHHPRFLMHDSPREGDMEGPLFRRLFEVVHYLETQFKNPEDISFQYIVTTTTLPPSELADEDGPYVRLTLDAIDDSNRLLKVKF